MKINMYIYIRFHKLLIKDLIFLRISLLYPSHKIQIIKIIQRTNSRNSVKDVSTEEKLFDYKLLNEIFIYFEVLWVIEYEVKSCR